MKTRSKARIFKPRALLVDFIANKLPIEPQISREALRDPEGMLSMGHEYDAFMRNGTWIIVPRDVDMNVIFDKWVFKTKFKTDGSLDKLKS